MSHNIYIKIKGHDGEVTEKGYEKNIGVLSFSHGLSMPINRSHTNVSSPSGTAVHQDFTFTKYLDHTTPGMNAAVVGGKNIAEIAVTVLEADSEKGVVVPLYVIEFKNVIIASISIGASIGDKPVETVSFVYHSIKWTFSKHKNQAAGGGGTPGKVPAGWDLNTNKAL